MNVFVILKRLEHSRIFGDVSQDPQLELRIVGGDEFVALFGNKRLTNTLSQFGADRYVLQIRLRRAETTRCGDGLIETTVDAPVLADHSRQSIGVGRTQLVEFAVVYDVLSDLICRGEFDQNVVTGRDLAGCRFASGFDV